MKHVLKHGYLVIEENAYYGYSANRYFSNIADAFCFYKELKKNVNDVFLISFQMIDNK